MYSGNPPLVGGAAGGLLATTGADSTWPIIIAVGALVIGALLKIRDHRLRVHDAAE